MDRTYRNEASILFISLFIIGASALTPLQNVIRTEMFALPISPNLFNWTYQEFDQQYHFHAALVGKPELPSWLRYIYSKRHHSGFIFGTPPPGAISPVKIDVVGLNRQDYETRRLLLELNIKKRQNTAKHEVEMKIDNLNVEDLLDEHRMTRLKEVFKSKIWTESADDLYPTFLASAIDMGARLPLKPNEGEGLVIRLGSTHPLSDELKRLREEVRPLSKLTSCPREYKRTTVERLFRDAGFMLDWCSFELYNTHYTEKSSERVEYLTELTKNDKVKTKKDYPKWNALSRADLPKRSYFKELTISVMVPLVLMLMSVAALTAVLCVHYAGVSGKRCNQERYETATSEQTHVPDNISNRSVGLSPDATLSRPKSTGNLAANYNRPQPPPYGTNANTLNHRKPDKTGLEKSIKILDEATINPEQEDDYVPINNQTGFLETETGFLNTSPGYVSMRNLDDVVQEPKYGVGI